MPQGRVAPRPGRGAVSGAGVMRGPTRRPDSSGDRGFDMRELIITNGDAAAGRLREARIGDEVLPWHDILYEGPLPLTESIGELSEIRIEYLGCAYPEP